MSQPDLITLWNDFLGFLESITGVDGLFKILAHIGLVAIIAAVAKWEWNKKRGGRLMTAGRHVRWLELNKIGVWRCDWEVLEVVVEGAVGDVGGEGREGVLRGVALEVGDIVLGGVPDVFCGIVVGGVGGHVDGCDALQGPTGGV